MCFHIRSQACARELSSSLRRCSRPDYYNCQTVRTPVTWTCKTWCVGLVEYYTTLKVKEMLTCVAPRVRREVSLREVNTTEVDSHARATLCRSGSLAVGPLPARALVVFRDEGSVNGQITVRLNCPTNKTRFYRQKLLPQQAEPR